MICKSKLPEYVHFLLTKLSGGVMSLPCREQCESDVSNALLPFPTYLPISSKILEVTTSRSTVLYANSSGYAGMLDYACEIRYA